MRNAKDLRVTWLRGPSPSGGSEPSTRRRRGLGVPTHTAPSRTAAPGTWPAPRSCPGRCSGCWRRWVRPPGRGRAGSCRRVCTSTGCSMPAAPTANAGMSAAAGATTAAPCPTSTPSATATSSATAPSPTAAPTSGSTAWASRPRSLKLQVRRNPPERCAAAGCDARVRTAAERGRVPPRSCLGHAVPDFTPWAAGEGWEGGGEPGRPPRAAQGSLRIPAEQSQLRPSVAPLSRPSLQLTLLVPTSLPPRLRSLRSRLSQRGHVPGQLQPVVSAPVLRRHRSVGTLTPNPAVMGAGPRRMAGADASSFAVAYLGFLCPRPACPGLMG